MKSVQNITKSNTIKVLGQMDNGGWEQWEIIGDNSLICQFIENYEGDDMLSDLILEDFVKDAYPTGITLSVGQ